jgi:cytochrome c-type biogenesis protein CcmH/NrfG
MRMPGSLVPAGVEAATLDAMSSSEAADPSPAPAPETPDAAAARTRTIRFFAVIGIAAVVALVAILVAVGLNQPSGSGSSTSGTSTTAAKAGLPQLAVVINRTDPVQAMAASNQAIALRMMIQRHPTAERYMALGQVEMSLADQQAAVDAFSRAAQLEPSSPDPMVGLAMTQAMPGSSGYDAATSQLNALAARFPNSQVVAFNVGWLALYRRDVATVKSAWAHTVALGPSTELGKTATALLAQIGRASGK